MRGSDAMLPLKTPADNAIIYVLDADYSPVCIFDTYESFIWTERYTEAGEFELYAPLSANNLEELQLGRYLSIDQSERYMVIESKEINTDVEGATATFKGRTLESILDRRVIWDFTSFSGVNVQNGLKTLITNNVISPTVTARAIPNFKFTEITDSVINGTSLETQYLGENLYDAVVELCQEQEFGWKILPYGAGGFEFKLYRGKNYSYDQTNYPYVVFSPSYDNLKSSNYYLSYQNYKTVIRVGGDGEGYDKRLGTAAVSDGAGSGLARRETYTDASVTSKDEEGKDLTEAQYQAALTQKGLEALADLDIDEAIDADVDVSRQFVYGEDFLIGDILQVEDDRGLTLKVRLSEVMWSWDINGELFTPTFTAAVYDD